MATELRYPVGSVENALRLLELFEDRDVVRVAEAGRHLGVARSTAHRLLQSLQSRGFVVQDANTRGYVVGGTLIRLSLVVTRGHDLTAAAHPVMREIVAELGETAYLTALQGAEVFFLETIESPKALRVGVRTGERLPAHSSAAGRVLLAELSADALRRLLPEPVLAAVTDKTQTNRDEIERVLDLVRQRGFATSFRESEDDVAAVAVPVRNAAGEAIAALAIAAPPTRLDEADADAIADRLKAGAERISAMLR